MPMYNQRLYEFRYITKIQRYATIAKSEPILVREDKDIKRLYGTESIEEVLYKTDVVKKYEIEIPKPPTNAILTIAVHKNRSACDTDLIVMVKHGELPTSEVNDFKEQSASQVTATFNIAASDSETYGKWYFTVQKSSQISAPCNFYMQTIYFIRCPNDCSQRGTCNNGTCHCSAGYTKADCSKGLTPFNPPKAPFQSILIIPGIGGTLLEFEPQGKKDKAFTAWVNIDNVISGTIYSARNKAFAEAMVGQYNSSTGLLQPLQYTIQGKMHPVDSNFGMRGISCLLDDVR